MMIIGGMFCHPFGNDNGQAVVDLSRQAAPLPVLSGGGYSSGSRCELGKQGMLLGRQPRAEYRHQRTLPAATGAQSGVELTLLAARLTTGTSKSRLQRKGNRRL